MSRGSLSLGHVDGPPCDTWHRSSHPGGILYGRRFHLLWIFHNRRLPPDGREVRFNFLGHTCSDPLATLTRSTSAADDSDYLDNLTRHTLAICRIHLCPQLRSKLRQHYRPSLLNYHSSSIQDTLDKTFLNLLRLIDAFPVLKIINWGDNRCLNTLLTAITWHQKGHDCSTTLWAAIMTMGPASTTRSYSLTHI